MPNKSGHRGCTGTRRSLPIGTSRPGADGDVSRFLRKLLAQHKRFVDVIGRLFTISGGALGLEVEDYDQKSLRRTIMGKSSAKQGGG